MNYPFWDIPVLGGSSLIAVIAILHVIVSHLAVGGGFYIYYTERKMRLENDFGLLSCLRGHARFFMLLTTVFGAVSGVGIWFVIGLVSPAATSTLIHIFIFAWAIEWVFFFVEIAAIIIYVYRFDELAHASREKVALIYFAAAWLSLFVINGIVTFMLTPGDYYVTKSFASAFFNPSFWPSLFIRSVICLLFAGVFAIFTATFIMDEKARVRTIRYSSYYLVPGLILTAPLAAWYFWTVPPLSKTIVTGGSPLIMMMAGVCAGSAALLTAAALAHSWIDPKKLSTIFAIILLIFAGTFMGTFELVREAVRKPFTLYGRMYSNSIYVDPAGKPELETAEFLPNLKWCPIKAIVPGGELAAGREIFRYQCQACHSLDGYNAVRPLTRSWGIETTRESVSRLNEIKGFMPPFFGSEAERDALSLFIYSLNNELKAATGVK